MPIGFGGGCRRALTTSFSKESTFNGERQFTVLHRYGSQPPGENNALQPFLFSNICRWKKHVDQGSIL